MIGQLNRAMFSGVRLISYKALMAGKSVSNEFNNSTSSRRYRIKNINDEVMERNDQPRMLKTR